MSQQSEIDNQELNSFMDNYLSNQTNNDLFNSQQSLAENQMLNDYMDKYNSAPNEVSQYFTQDSSCSSQVTDQTNNFILI